MGTRDDMCGMDVGRMEDLGGFAEEITILGCAYKQDGEVLYRVTDSADEAYAFYESAARKGLLPTLPQTYVRREIIPAGQRERMTDEAKLACARQMRDDFDAAFWQLFDRLNAGATSNRAYIPFLIVTVKSWKGAMRVNHLTYTMLFLTKRCSVAVFNLRHTCSLIPG